MRASTSTAGRRSTTKEVLVNHTLTTTAFGVLVNLRERYQDSDPEVAMLLDAIEMLDEADRAHLLSKVEDLIYRRDHVSMETSIT